MSNRFFTLDEITEKVEDISKRLMGNVIKNSKWEENTITEHLCAELRELLGFSEDDDEDDNTGKAVEIENTTFGETFFVLLDAQKISIKKSRRKERRCCRLGNI
ncbi:hypothetical protein [Desulfurobacterium sp.]